MNKTMNLVGLVTMIALTASTGRADNWREDLARRTAEVIALSEEARITAEDINDLIPVVADEISDLKPSAGQFDRIVSILLDKYEVIHPEDRETIEVAVEDLRPVVEPRRTAIPKTSSRTTSPANEVKPEDVAPPVSPREKGTVGRKPQTYRCADTRCKDLW